jgi:hypothetical protein
MIGAVLCAGLVAPAGAEEGVKARPYDRAVLSEIADDVLRRGLRGPDRSVPVETSPSTAARAEDFEGVEMELPPDSPASHMAPAREGITVATPPGATGAKKTKPGPAAAGYRSNSSRRGQGPPAPALNLPSGVPAPPSGLDAALQAQGAEVAARGRPVVYGFVRLAGPRDEAVEQQLAAFGVELLAPHDDHHKARLPVGSLDVLAAVPGIAWLGVSPPERKLSAELTELLGPQKKQAGIDRATPIPIVINLFEGDQTGAFRLDLEAAGATIGDYDPELQSYRAVATEPVIEQIAALDFVLFVELIGMTTGGHDQSTPLMDADIIRPGTPLGHTRFSGATVQVGVMDSGFDMGGGRHADLNKFGCGLDLSSDAGSPFADGTGHGTHVLGTIVGTGTANPRYRGVATGVGSIDRIRVAKIWNTQGQGTESTMADGMDFMSQLAACNSVRPEVINISGGHHGTAQTGTDSLSRKLDEKVWTYGQAYVVCSGNEGPLTRSIRRPGVAKNALTVGNVFDWGYPQVGDLAQTSSLGPTGDGRMKPNIVAAGTSVFSARAGTTGEYIEKEGCSMATPHVTGLVATLMDHYPNFRGRPALLRAHLMATAIGHEDAVDRSDLYGLGRASGYLAHWDNPNSAGWQTFKFWGGVTSQGYQYNDITVPPNTRRLIVVLTWDEPPASAGASRAVTYDLDLWVDHEATCPYEWGDCGDYQSVSFVDNVEYIVVENPPPGLYRLKAHPYSAPTFNLPYGMVARIIRGDPRPAMYASLSAPEAPTVGSTFTLTLSASTLRYLVSGAQVELTSSTPPGLTFLGFNTRRHDGVDTGHLDPEGQWTLGNLVPMLGRSATWTYRADSPGPKTFTARVWSENAGEVIATKTIQVAAVTPDLVATTLGTSPAAPVTAPGGTFSVTDTVQNIGLAASAASTTRYYLSLDGVKSTGDRLQSGTRAVPALAGGASDTGTVTVTVNGDTPLKTYFLLACADDLGRTTEASEANNCVAAATGPVTVTRPDLVETAVSAPPATAARGTAFTVTDTMHNAGAVAAGATTTRYYLSLDQAKSAGDKLLPGPRAVPALAAGASHSGTVTVTIPASTLLKTYFLLACADNASKVAETDEKNNCTASSSTVTVTP